MERKLYRSMTKRIIWGVRGGLTNYFDIDPMIVRIVGGIILNDGMFNALG